jgi:hypothetical protein
MTVDRSRRERPDQAREATSMTTLFDQTPGVGYLDESTGATAAALGLEAGEDSEPIMGVLLGDEDEAEAPKKRGGGPKTARGKAQSKRNSLTHGLWAKEVLPEGMEVEVVQCTGELIAEFKPRTPYGERLVKQLARILVQVDHGQALQIVDVGRRSDRATLFWDDDRQKHVEDLGVRLEKDPVRVRLALKLTRQGTEWIVERLVGLRDVVQTSKALDEEQYRHCLDLFGVAPVLRKGGSTVPAADDVAGLTRRIDAELADHCERLETKLIDMDEATRETVRAGMPGEEDETTKQLRKACAARLRERRQVMGELLRVLALPPGDGEPPRTPDPAPKSQSKSESESKPTSSSTTDSSWPVETGRPVQSKAAQEFQWRELKTYDDFQDQCRQQRSSNNANQNDNARANAHAHAHAHVEPVAPEPVKAPEPVATATPREAPKPAATAAPTVAPAPRPVTSRSGNLARPSLAEMVVGDHRNGRQRRAEEKRQARAAARGKGR